MRDKWLYLIYIFIGLVELPMQMKLSEIVETRDIATLVSKNFRLHPQVDEAFTAHAKMSGHTQIYLLEKYIIEGLLRDQRES